MDQFYKQAFPQLRDVAEKKTSEKDDRYNCIAWAFSDNRRWWWPNSVGNYWPVDAFGLTTMEAFEALFADLGWESSDNIEDEPGFEKIALYAKDGNPTHAARMSLNGMWTSKLGPDIDLVHELAELEGGSYGDVVAVFRRSV